MGEPSVKKDVGKELPQEKLAPDQNRNESEVEIDAAADQHLKKEDRSHDDHQPLKHRRKTITKREMIALVSHVNLPLIMNDVSVSNPPISPLKV
jgi:hypothetical protein